MRWQDISIDGEWSIPAEPREKNTAGITGVARDGDRDHSRAAAAGHNPYVFAGRGDRPDQGLGQGQTSFDAKLTDVTRVGAPRSAAIARTDGRAGIRPDIAERVMGHAIAGVEGVYDRHHYRDEKADALDRLAALIETILDPPKGNVRRIREAAQ